jgi:exodeoxyribonuclease VII large subunit
MKKAADDLPLFARQPPRFFTVSELNAIIKETLEQELDGFWVAGEVSNFRVPPSGHYYFTLKDDRSQIAAVMFRRQGLELAFVPENGMAVLCFGKASLYPVRGDLQLYVETMEPRGQGALYLAFEQLKKKLSAEGLFAEEHKKMLPFLPASIGIVTSEKGAALRDMLRIIGDRYPDRRIVVKPVRVQGEGAAEEIAAGITELALSGEVEVLIVGRGGGSLEDLWAFNEEIVARSIFASPVPVISAVGHEIDFTIADFVADLRAPTPTAAAEVVVPRRSELVEQVMHLEQRLLKCMRRRLDMAKDSCRVLARRLADPERKLRETQQRVDELSVDLVRRLRDRVRQLKDRLVLQGGRLDALSPLAVLDRGYSITHKLPAETIVKDAAALNHGDLVRVTFAKGKAICQVESKE